MSNLWQQCRALSDEELIEGLQAATDTERRALASLLVHLAEFDARRLTEKSAFPSLYIYCTKHLRYSEDAAYIRIRAAKTVRRFPLALDLLESGEIHLTAIMYLAPHLTEENHVELLNRAKGKTKRDVEKLVAGFEPRAPRPDIIKPFSTPAPAADGSCSEPELLGLGSNGNGLQEPEEPQTPLDTAKPALGSGLLPLAGESTEEPREAPPRLGARISFDVGFEFLAKLERIKQLLSNKHRMGKLSDVFDDAMEAFLDQKDPERRMRRREARRQRRAQRAREDEKGGARPGP